MHRGVWGPYPHVVQGSTVHEELSWGYVVIEMPARQLRSMCLEVRRDVS